MAKEDPVIPSIESLIRLCLLRLLPVFRRGEILGIAEYPRKVGCTGTAALLCNLTHLQAAGRQQIFRTLDAAVSHILLILFSNKDAPHPFSLSNAHDCMCGKVVDSLTKTVNHLF